MIKLIILPNNVNLKGIFIKFNKFSFKNLFELIRSFTNLKGYCGGFGKCKTCSIIVKEGFLKNNNPILSCEQKNILKSLIIDF